MDTELFLKEKDELNKKITFYLISYKGGKTLTEIANDIINLTDKSEIQKSLSLNILRDFINKKTLISNDGIYEINKDFNHQNKIENITFCNECGELISTHLNNAIEFYEDDEIFFCSLYGKELIREENSSKILIPGYCKKR